jgi:hypothetical protein
MTEYRENPRGYVIRECADLDQATNTKLITLQEQGRLSFHYGTNPSESYGGTYYVFTVHDDAQGDQEYRVKLKAFSDHVNVEYAKYQASQDLS